MDLKKFEILSETPKPVKFLVWQDWAEFQTYLEFVSSYFKNRGVTNPLVVEIGILHNEQQLFYREILNADYIGMDIEQNNEPDVLGDSGDPNTKIQLRSLLDGRSIDLLFIDGNHTYDGVKKDYELYAPLTKHLIAFHDVYSETKPRALGVNQFWAEMVRSNQHMTAVFHRFNSKACIKEQRFMNEGIGVVIKEL